MSAAGRPRQGRFGVGAGILAALAIGLACTAQSCGGGDKALVIIALTALPPDARLTQVTIDVDSVSTSFPLAGGLSDAPKKFGVYVPSGLTSKMLIVAATAHRNDPKGCGYLASLNTKISNTTADAPLTLELMPATT